MNSLDWKIYESLTKYIYETLRKEYNINIEGHGQNCKIRGYSGVIHQIDVLTSEFCKIYFSKECSIMYISITN